MSRKQVVISVLLMAILGVALSISGLSGPSFAASPLVASGPGDDPVLSYTMALPWVTFCSPPIPIIRLDPEGFELYVTQGDEIQVVMDVGNVGCGNLNFSFGSCEWCWQADPDSGTVPRGETREVTFTFRTIDPSNGTTLEPGLHRLSILMETDDQNREEVTIPVQLTVLPEGPDLDLYCVGDGWIKAVPDRSYFNLDVTLLGPAWKPNGPLVTEWIPRTGASRGANQVEWSSLPVRGGESLIRFRIDPGTEQRATVVVITRYEDRVDAVLGSYQWSVPVARCWQDSDGWGDPLIPCPPNCP